MQSGWICLGCRRVDGTGATTLGWFRPCQILVRAPCTISLSRRSVCRLLAIKIGSRCHDEWQHLIENVRSDQTEADIEASHQSHALHRWQARHSMYPSTASHPLPWKFAMYPRGKQQRRKAPGHFKVPRPMAEQFGVAAGKCALHEKQAIGGVTHCLAPFKEHEPKPRHRRPTRACRRHAPCSRATCGHRAAAGARSFAAMRRPARPCRPGCWCSAGRPGAPVCRRAGRRSPPARRGEVLGCHG